MIKIDEFLVLWIDNKQLHFTAHVRDEIDYYNKDTIFIAEIIDKGEKRIVSKNDNRYEAVLLIGKTEWIVSYVIRDEYIVAIHLGLKK